MQPFDIYKRLYQAGIVVFLLALFVPWLESAYALMFFGGGLFLLFSYQKPMSDPGHSTVTHYEQFSRNNIFNYVLMGILLVGSLAFVFSPISRPLTLFVIWSVALVIINYMRKNYLPQEFPISAIADYIHTQMPEVSKQKITQAINDLQLSPNADVNTLSQAIELDTTSVQNIIHYYKVYEENNLQQPINQPK